MQTLFSVAPTIANYQIRGSAVCWLKEKLLLGKRYYSCTTRGALPAVRSLPFPFDAISPHPRGWTTGRRDMVLDTSIPRWLWGPREPNLCPSNFLPRCRYALGGVRRAGRGLLFTCTSSIGYNIFHRAGGEEEEKHSFFPN